MTERDPAVRLNPDDFETMRQTRDPRFDGQVFIAVVTTGIYCRPICPARIPKKENIRLYRSSAEAAEAGFRPCLRCRPESAPGTPQWLGSSHTVSRALKLISHGALNDGSVEQLAISLGTGVRQLNRLFTEFVGASPLAVANNQKLHLAKKLIDETNLPMAEVCFAAGFSSVRRFNAVFQSVYQRTPLSLRRTGVGVRGALSDVLQLKLHFRPPFDWPAMLRFLAFRAIPGVESVGETTYARTIIVDGTASVLHVQFTLHENWLVLSLPQINAGSLYAIVERVREMFDLKALSHEIDSALAKDTLLRPMILRFPGTRVPVAWDGFEVAVRAIIGQQISVKGATTLVSRLARAYGSTSEIGALHGLTHVFPKAEVLANATMDSLGITTRRIEAIRALAKDIVEMRIRFDGSMSTEQLQEALVTIRGIGPWTAQYVALRALGDPDAFPDADLILLRAASEGDAPLTPKQLLGKSQQWRPWRAYAVLLLWRHYAESKTA
jgi:AraC family transcriptional regulator of adaptative response / DNA-3-methyladenine glycosylase II